MDKKTHSNEDSYASFVNEPMATYSIASPTQLPQKAEKSSVPPCQYTIEEIAENAKQAFYEYKQGKGVPHKLIKRKVLL